ncbi:MAG: ATP-binding protein [Euryarchaeota archaeon]|nr:ATP-binding protein [Euryarchaeota archaeon]MBU4143316.1 ATP-binding protein [Candidatus Thermoplasmatota archaeon]
MAKIRVRARAVDMLGRQQIAGIPTALHEILKNAHDAYADYAEVDYFRQDKSLLIRDDGIGMTKDEFELRWLTIGTESKLELSGIIPPYRDPNKPLRSILGEKGIGRLSIAAIGKQVLVLTRAERDGVLHDIVACFIHWGLFEIPGLDLSEIEIPVETWSENVLPNRKFVDKLVESVRKNVNKLGNKFPETTRISILHDLESFKIAPDVLSKRLEGLSLANGRGTHFFIHPVDSILETDIDGGGDTKLFAPPLKKNLIGFCNTMTPDAPVPAVRITFRDHRMDGSIHDLVDPDIEFFTPGDFKSADHQFDGVFNEFGQFDGTISIYGGKPIKYVLPWNGARGKPTSCGPFRLKMAYVQGLQRESRLPPEIYGPITNKLNQIGGVYVYRDGIRILPYGNSDYDWLGVERRRNLAAKDYFFSYRRIFGVVEIKKEANPGLIEKAGREGFMENAAFRQVRELVQNFLVEVVREYFRKGSNLADDFWRIKIELDRQDILLKQREKRISNKKQNFASELGNFFQKIENSKPTYEVNNIKDSIEAKLKSVSAQIESNPEEAGRILLKIEATLRTEIADLRKRYSITRPRGMGLTKNQQDNWNAYMKEAEELENKHFKILEKHLQNEINKAFASLSSYVDKRRRIDQMLQEMKKQTESDAKRMRTETTDEVKSLQDTVLVEIKEHMEALQNTLKETLIEFEQMDLSTLSDAEQEKYQTELARKLESSSTKELKGLESVRDQLTMLNEALANDESISDVTIALEERVDSFKNQIDQYAELAQIGTAVGIVQHEFSSTVKMMHDYIKQLRAWAVTNPQIDEIYQNIRINFEHFDEYMNVFKPFDRRLQRKKMDIPGQEIRYYLQRLFEDRLARHNIKIKATRKFDNAIICTYPSTIYPCFVNIVDNAIYWITKDAEGRPRIGDTKKEIRLDADDNGLFVSNSGPGIKRRIADRIFDFGYSEKKNGRGMGLYISREILRREGLDLVLEESGKNVRPIFRIVFGSGKQEESDE